MRDSATIGAIVNCPKCGGMVQILPPPGWEQPPAEPEQHEEPARPQRPQKVEKSPAQPNKQTPLTRPARAADAPSSKPVAKVTPAPSTSDVAPERDHAKPQAPSKSGAQPQPENRKTSGKKPVETAAAGAPVGAGAASPSVPPPAPPIPAEAANLQMPPSPVEGTAPPVHPPAEMGLVESTPTPPMTQWVNPAEVVLRRWLMWGALPVAGIVILIGAWALFSRGDSSPQPNENSPAPVAAVPDTGTAAPLEPIAKLDTRWIPESPQLVLNLDVAGTEAAGQLAPLLTTVPAMNQVIVAELFQGFGLKPAAGETPLLEFRRPYRMGGDKCRRHRIDRRPYDTGPFRSAGVAAAKQAGSLEIRLLDRPTWKRAFAILDQQTIVTGEEGLLRQLVERGHRTC